MKHYFIFFLSFFFSSVVFAAQTPVSASLNTACPAQVSGTHGARLLGADTITSDIVINACVAMGGNAQQLIQNNQDGVCTITSGYRSPQRNQAVGGASQSQHMQGKAVDVVVRGSAQQFGQLLLAGLCCKNRCIGGLGYYNNNKFHVDNRQAVAAWGPDYRSSSIPQIADQAMRELLATFLRNGSNVRLADGSTVHSATGQVLSTVQGMTQNTPIVGIVQGMVVTGASEDGQWALNPNMMNYPPQSTPMQQSTYQNGGGAVPVQQQYPPQSYPQYAAQQQPQQTQQTVYPQTAQTNPSQTTAPVSRDVIVPPTVEPSRVPTAVAPDEDEEKIISEQKKPFMKCGKNMDNLTLELSWSCGSTQGKKVHVQSNGFDAKGLPQGSLVMELPETTRRYVVSCSHEGVVLAKASCVVKRSPKTEEILDYSGSFSVTKEAKKPTAWWCLFSKCLW